MMKVSKMELVVVFLGSFCSHCAGHCSCGGTVIVHDCCACSLFSVSVTPRDRGSPGCSWAQSVRLVFKTEANRLTMQQMKGRWRFLLKKFAK